MLPGVCMLDEILFGRKGSFARLTVLGFLSMTRRVVSTLKGNQQGAGDVTKQYRLITTNIIHYNMPMK